MFWSCPAGADSWGVELGVFVQLFCVNVLKSTLNAMGDDMERSIGKVHGMGWAQLRSEASPPNYARDKAKKESVCSARPAP